MKAKWIFGILAAMLLALPLSGCNKGGELYPNEKLLRHEIAAADNQLKINVKDKDKERLFVLTPMSIEYDDAKMQKAFEERNYRLRQIANEYFRELSYEDLQDPRIATTAGEALAEKFNDEFGTETIQKVYMEGYVLAHG